MSALFYLINVKDVARHHAAVSLWGPNERGYVTRLAAAGRYTEEHVRGCLYRLNSGCSALAVSAEVVERIAEPVLVDDVPTEVDGEPVRRVPNTRAAWRALIAGAIEPPPYKPEPQFPGAPRRDRPGRR